MVTTKIGANAGPISSTAGEEADGAKPSSPPPRRPCGGDPLAEAGPSPAVLRVSESQAGELFWEESVLAYVFSKSELERIFF